MAKRQKNSHFFVTLEYLEKKALLVNVSVLQEYI